MVWLPGGEMVEMLHDSALNKSITDIDITLD